MKLFILSISLLSCFSLICVPQLEVSIVQDELDIMDHLIEKTQNSMEQQREIRTKIREYKRYRYSFLQENENKELACELIATAEELLDRIDEARISPYFKDDFLEELQFFSQIAHKKTRLTAP